MAMTDVQLRARVGPQRLRRPAKRAARDPTPGLLPQCRIQPVRVADACASQSISDERDVPFEIRRAYHHHLLFPTRRERPVSVLIEALRAERGRRAELIPPGPRRLTAGVCAPSIRSLELMSGWRAAGV